MSVAVLGAYAQILGQRQRRLVVGAALLGRLQRSMSNLVVLLLVAQHTGSYGTAGAVASASIIGVGVGGPAWSRLSDRRGQRLVLALGLSLSVLSAIALIAVVTQDAPRWTWLLAGFAVGATALDFGTLIRARWAHALDDPAERHTALALESVLDELSFVLGPSLAAGLAAGIGAGWALGVATMAGIIGGAALAWYGDDVDAVAVPEEHTTTASGRRRLLPRGVLPMLPAYAGVGMGFATIDVSAVAAASDADASGMAGLIVAAFAGGSVLAGIVVGPLTATWSMSMRLVVSFLGYALIVPLLLLVHDLHTMLAVGFVVGLSTSPVLIAAMSYIQSHAEQHRRTEAMAWPGVAISAGVTIGALLAGSTIDADGAFAGLRIAVLGAVVVGASAVVLRLGARRAVSAR